MAEQRSRAKADAQARKTGHADLSAYRSVLDAGGPVEFTGYTEVARESPGPGAARRRRPASRRRARATTVELVLDTTPFYAEGGGQQPDTGHDHRRRRPGRGARRAAAGARPDRAPGPGAPAARCAPARPATPRSTSTRRRAISRSHTATHLVHQTMRNFLGESATQAGSLNAPGPAAVRLQHPVGGAAERAARRRAAGQRGAAGDLEVHAFITSQEEARRIGAMALFGEKYGERGPGRRGRRLRPRAVRRHARGPLRPARPGEDPLRGVDRLRRAPGRGAGRHGRVRLPGPRARAGLPARRAVPGARRAGRRPGRADRHRSCATPRRSWRSCAPSWCWAARRRSPAQATDVRRGRVRRHRGARGRGRQRRAHPGPGDPRQDRPGAAGGGRGGGPRRTARRRWSWRSTRPARSRGLAAARPGQGRRLSGRGGGSADLAQGGGVPADRGAEPARARSRRRSPTRDGIAPAVRADADWSALARRRAG